MPEHQFTGRFANIEALKPEHNLPMFLYGIPPTRYGTRRLHPAPARGEGSITLLPGGVRFAWQVEDEASRSFSTGFAKAIIIAVGVLVVFGLTATTSSGPAVAVTLALTLAVGVALFLLIGLKKNARPESPLPLEPGDDRDEADEPSERAVEIPMCDVFEIKFVGDDLEITTEFPRLDDDGSAKPRLVWHLAAPLEIENDLMRAVAEDPDMAAWRQLLFNKHAAAEADIEIEVTGN